MSQPVNKICASCTLGCKQLEWVAVVGCVRYTPRVPRAKPKNKT